MDCPIAPSIAGLVSRPVLNWLNGAVLTLTQPETIIAKPNPKKAAKIRNLVM